MLLNICDNLCFFVHGKSMFDISFVFLFFPSPLIILVYLVLSFCFCSFIIHFTLNKNNLLHYLSRYLVFFLLSVGLHCLHLHIPEKLKKHHNENSEIIFLNKKSFFQQCCHFWKQSKLKFIKYNDYQSAILGPWCTNKLWCHWVWT